VVQLLVDWWQLTLSMPELLLTRSDAIFFVRQRATLTNIQTPLAQACNIAAT